MGKYDNLTTEEAKKKLQEMEKQFPDLFRHSFKPECREQLRRMENNMAKLKARLGINTK